MGCVAKITLANLLILRHFVLMTTWLELASKTKEEFDECFAHRGLLLKERPRTKCEDPCSDTISVFVGEVFF